MVKMRMQNNISTIIATIIIGAIDLCVIADTTSTIIATTTSTITPVGV